LAQISIPNEQANKPRDYPVAWAVILGFWLTALLGVLLKAQSKGAVDPFPTAAAIGASIVGSSVVCGALSRYRISPIKPLFAIGFGFGTVNMLVISGAVHGLIESAIVPTYAVVAFVNMIVFDGWQRPPQATTD